MNLGDFTSYLCGDSSEKYTKRDVISCCFAVSLPVSLLSPSSLLKLPITSSINRETRQFHVVVEKEKNVPKS